MNTIFDRFMGSMQYLTTIQIPDIFDILIVAFLIYKLIGFIRKTSTFRVARGIVLLLLALMLSSVLKLNVISFILRRAFELGLIALVILFQPELRRMLEKMGSRKLIKFFSGEAAQPLEMDSVISHTVQACSDMSASKTGALIIFERESLLSEPVSTGTIINADVTTELLKNLFYPKAPLHDGAVIIKGCRVAAAGCMLPLSSNVNLSKELGMRHRAGIGMSEQSDAVVVIVSEETGAISVAVDGMLKRHLAPKTLELVMRRELINDAMDENGVKKRDGKLNLLNIFRNTGVQGKKNENKRHDNKKNN